MRSLARPNPCQRYGHRRMTERLRLLKNEFWRVVMPIIIGLLAIVLAGLGVIYYQQQREQSALAEQKTLQSNVIESFTEREAAFEAELEQTQAEFNSMEAAFLEELTENDVYKAVLLLAQDANVTVDMKPGSETTEKVEGIEYRVLNFTLSVSGGYYNVLSFIQTLDSQQTLLGSLMVKGLSVKMSSSDTRASVDCKVYALS